MDEALKKEEERLLRSLGKGSNASQRLKEEAERKKKQEERKKREEAERKAAEERRKEELRRKEEARLKALEEERQNAPPPSEVASNVTSSAPRDNHPLVDTSSCIAGVFDPKEEEREAQRMKKMFAAAKPVPEDAEGSGGYLATEKSEQQKEEERMRKQFGGGKPQSSVGELPETKAKVKAGETSKDISKPPTPPVYIKGAPVVPQGPGTISTSFETEVWSEANKLRMNPSHYIAHLHELEKNYEGNNYKVPGTDAVRKTVEGVSALFDAIKTLEKAKACEVLDLSAIFSKSALELVEDKGPRGEIDTKLSDGTLPAVRLLRHGTWKKKVAELVALGAVSGRDAVLQWLIDDGNPTRSNRLTLLDPAFRVIGVSSGYHSKHHRITVACLTTEFHAGETAHGAPTLASAAPTASFTATEGELNIANFVLGANGNAPRVELDLGESRLVVQVKILPSKYASELQVFVKNENVLEVVSKHIDEGGNHVVSTRTASLPTVITPSNFQIVSQTPQGITLKINKIFRK